MIGDLTAIHKFSTFSNDAVSRKAKTRLGQNALRCAFAHQYSLINVGKGHNAALLHHQFNVHRGELLIALPPFPWNGIRTEATNNLITSISLKKLGDLVEEIHKTLLIMASENQLKDDGELIFIHYPVL